MSPGVHPKPRSVHPACWGHKVSAAAFAPLAQPLPSGAPSPDLRAWPRGRAGLRPGLGGPVFIPRRSFLSGTASSCRLPLRLQETVGSRGHPAPCRLQAATTAQLLSPIAVLLSSVRKHLSPMCVPSPRRLQGGNRGPCPGLPARNSPHCVHGSFSVASGAANGGGRLRHTLSFLVSSAPNSVCIFPHLWTQFLTFFLLIRKSSLSILVSTLSVICIANTLSYSVIVSLPVCKVLVFPLKCFPFLPFRCFVSFGARVAGETP